MQHGVYYIALSINRPTKKMGIALDGGRFKTTRIPRKGPNGVTKQS